MRSLSPSLLLCLLIGVQVANCTFWPFVPWGNPFATQAVAQPVYQQPVAQLVYQQPVAQPVYQPVAQYHYPQQAGYGYAQVQQRFYYPQVQQQAAYPQVQQQSYGASPWGFGRKRRQAVIKSDLVEFLNPTCKSEKLRTLMLENMSGSTDQSTLAIQHAAKELGDFDVICGKGDLSFAINSKMFCKEQLEDVTCYAFSSEY